MNKIKEELELLKSWGFETVSIDKVLEMIERTDNTEVESDKKSVINIFLPSDTRTDVDRYFRDIPMYVTSDRTYPGPGTTGFRMPEPDVWIC